MRPALAIGAVGVRRGLRSRALLLMGVVGPLALGAILALAFGGSGPSLSVGLLDEDGSEVSREVVAGLVEGTEGSQLDVMVFDDRSAAVAGVDDGDVGAVLVVPSGWAGSLAGDRPESLSVVGSAEAGIATSVMEAIAADVAARADLQRAVLSAYLTEGLDPAAYLTSGPPDAAIAVEQVDFTERFDGALYFGPLAVFLFLGLAGTAKGLLRDQASGVLGRIRSAPVALREVLAGTAGTVLVQGALAASVVILASSVVFGASWGTPYEVAAVIGCFVVSVAGLLGLVVGVARSELQAESWSNVMAFTFAILGGSFFGGAMMDGVLGVVGTLTPNGAAMRALIDLGPGGRSLAEVWYLLAWMLLVGVVGLLVGGRLLRRRLS